MYAIIKTGGKQYCITEGQILKVEKLAGNIGQTVQFDNVLMVAADGKLHFGCPYVQGTKVIAKIASHGRGYKINVIKFKRRKHYLKRIGHRQNFTAIKIINILLDKNR
ncbi:50S ribosomal protein L21 [Coxiella endosymbiont of Amblyomma nuttalli]|uniref:50S ribosomal protein L21 n=1 Tax=Coxiella endosymbiont of Amblyomma nuttalli TaxID=2749996 RepID=UPI001BABA533|nr:50S ribosomal protein L21 [Coxiella endosymbiont of Amblyomma nuttalli]QTS84022.1 50S ribosomal protein L21 [Coxiella endosymbiont of Amblyomma nuttalli]